MPAKILSVAVLLAGLTACSRDNPTTAEREDSAARAAGRAAYNIVDHTKKAAKRAGRELKEAGKEAREGWKEEKREDQAPKPSPMPRR